MKKTNDFILAISPITQRVYAGRVKQNEGYALSVGARYDVTSHFYECIIRMGDFHKGAFVINANGEPAYEVTVKKIN